MTIKFTSERLAKLGYRGLTAEQYNELNSELYQAAEEIVGMKLASSMNTRQLDEFEHFFNARDNEGAFKWIEREFPHYAQVVEGVIAELEALLEETARKTRAPFPSDDAPPSVPQDAEEGARG